MYSGSECNKLILKLLNLNKDNEMAFHITKLNFPTRYPRCEFSIFDVFLRLINFTELH